MKTITLLSISITFLLGCTAGSLSKNTSADSSKLDTSTTKTTKYRDTYEGIIPCADCPGIKLRLELNYTDSNTFVLSSTYLERNNSEPLITIGNFNTERGLGADIDATLIILDYDKKGKEQYFVRYSTDSTHISMLGKDRAPIESDLNFKLKKIIK